MWCAPGGALRSAAIGLTFALVGCSGDGGEADGTLPTAPAGVGLSPDGPWHLVASAPGITTPGLVYELMPKLWAFIQLEETETSAYPWTLNDADRPSSRPTSKPS